MRLKLRQGVVMQRLGAEAILLDTQSAAYFELNATGVVLLERLLAGDSLQAAARALSAQFEVEASTAERDGLRLLSALHHAGLTGME